MSLVVISQMLSHRSWIETDKAPATAGVKILDDGPHTVLEVTGEIDAASAYLLSQALRAVVARPAGRIIVDLSELTFLDTAGLRALVVAREACDRAGRWLVTRGATGQPQRLLDIGRIHYGLKL